MTMAESSKKRVKAAPEPEQEPAAAEAPHVCSVGFCPICLAVSALQPLRPEVVGHLLNAGRELLLAMMAVVETRSEDVGGDGSRERKLERIDIA